MRFVCHCEECNDEAISTQGIAAAPRWPRNDRLRAFILCFCASLLLCFSPQTSAKDTPKAPEWVTNLPIPQNETLYLVVKGIESNREAAEKLQAFIQQLMVKTPGDGVDNTDNYEGLTPGKFVVGMLFDTKERALWWIDYSYRNRTISKGNIQTIKVTGESQLPYMPSAISGAPKRILSEEEALEHVKAISDIKAMALEKKLQYKFTDYPRNGDLRYEIEVMEDRGTMDPLMIDFVMISALNGQVTERYSESLGQKISAKEP